MPGTKKLFRVRPAFTKKLNPAAKVKQARGIYLDLKNNDGSRPDFEQEAENLATVLKLIFPRRTLVSLKGRLPDS